MIRYFTGVSIAETRAARRPDLGILATPDSGIQHQRDDYLGGWAADNAFYGAPRPDGSAWSSPVLGGPSSSTAREVRYGMDPKQEGRWLRWIEGLDPRGCFFATLPDVVEDYAATWERSAKYVALVRDLGFPVAIVLQDGVEGDRFVWRSILGAADAVFIGGSDAWKLGPAVPPLVAEAKARGLWVHMGRVNSGKRLAYADSIGCDSADGTFLKYCAKKDQPHQYKRMIGWLDKANGAERLPFLKVVA